MPQTSSPTVAPGPGVLDRARDGDQEAWNALFEACYPKVLRVARRRLNWPLRKYYDSADIANEVMKSLAAKFDQFDFSTIDGLQAFLVRAAEQKLIDGHRKGQARKRDLGRDRPFGATDGSRAWEPADSAPTASQIAVATEEAEILLGGQEGPQRVVLELKLQGFSNPEVARRTGWNLRKVERFLEKLRGKCRL